MLSFGYAISRIPSSGLNRYFDNLFKRKIWSSLHSTSYQVERGRHHYFSSVQDNVAVSCHWSISGASSFGYEKVSMAGYSPLFLHIIIMRKISGIWLPRLWAGLQLLTLWEWLASRDEKCLWKNIPSSDSFQALILPSSNDFLIVCAYQTL